MCLAAKAVSYVISLHTQVDETLLSEECLDEDLPPLPPPPSYPGVPNPFVQMALPGGGIVSLPLDSSSRVGSPSPSIAGHDVLSVTAGEPVTHFNLDQLLEIVQSFQLDTTHAHGMGQEKSQSHKKVCLAGLRPITLSLPWPTILLCT